MARWDDLWNKSIVEANDKGVAEVKMFYHKARIDGLRAALYAVKYEHDLEHTNTGHCVDAVRKLIEQTKGDDDE